MPQLTEIRKELKFNIELVQLIETLKNIAAQQYHQMEKEKERFDQFMDAFAGFFRVVNLVHVEDPLVTVATDRLGIVVMTSDSGFMGGLNGGVINAALKLQGDLPNEQVSLVVVGDKGAGTFQDQGRTFKAFRGVTQDTIYEQAVEMKNYIVPEVLARRMGKVVVVYPKPVSFSAQTIETINLLPCAELFSREAEAEGVGPVGVKGVIAGAAKEASTVIVESSFSDMVEYLAGTWVISKLFEVFEDSKLAELSARALHLEGSLQKLEKDLKKVKHLAFKASHEKIDKGMRESFSAKGGQKKKRAAARAATHAMNAANAAATVAAHEANAAEAAAASAAISAA